MFQFTSSFSVGHCGLRCSKCCLPTPDHTGYLPSLQHAPTCTGPAGRPNAYTQHWLRGHAATNCSVHWINYPFEVKSSPSRSYQIFWEAVGLERGPLSFVSAIEELFGWNSSGSGLESREYGSGGPLRWPRDTLYPKKLALTSSTSSGRSIGIVRSRIQVTEFSF
jgi:hypothetical protein